MAWLRARRVGAVSIASEVSRFRRLGLSSSGRGYIVKVLDAVARCPGVRLPRPLLFEQGWKSVAIWLSAKISLAAGCLGWQSAGGLVAALDLADEVFGTPSRVHSGLRHSVGRYLGVSPKIMGGIVRYVIPAEYIAHLMQSIALLAISHRHGAELIARFASMRCRKLPFLYVVRGPLNPVMLNSFQAAS